MRAIMQPKTIGTWLLHRLLKDAPLDFLVLFSSFSSILTLPFLTHYASGNAFLDALAHYRTSLGLPALSMNWGLWGEAGLRAHLLLPALQTFSAHQALSVLERMLCSPTAQTGIARVDWTQQDLDPRIPKIRLLSDLVSEAQASEQPHHTFGESPSYIRDIILAAPATDRHQLLTNFVCSEIAKTLHVAADRVPRDTPLHMLGLDSLTGIELKRKFETSLQITIPIMALLAGPTIEQFVTQILNDWEAFSTAANMQPQCSQLSPARVTLGAPSLD
jgi:hypothetical protein